MSDRTFAMTKKIGQPAEGLGLEVTFDHLGADITAACGKHVHIDPEHFEELIAEFDRYKSAVAVANAQVAA